MKRVLISIILCIPVYTGEIFAQIEGYENMFIDDFRYGLFVPPDYNPDVGHHLMLYLHGALFLDDVDLPWYQPEFQEKYPTIVITPKCSPNLDDGKGWGNSDAMEETFCTAMAFRAVDSVLKYYNIDTTKMHVGGHSMGAYGTFYILASRPGSFASAVALSGGGNAAVANLIKETPLWIFHGGEDNVVATSASRTIFQAIRDAGGKLVRYTEYPRKGHKIWEEFI
jgi:predicted peptidase